MTLQDFGTLKEGDKVVVRTNFRVMYVAATVVSVGYKKCMVELNNGKRVWRRHDMIKRGD